MMSCTKIRYSICESKHLVFHAAIEGGIRVLRCPWA